MTGTPQKALVIFVDETDMWHELRLYEAIVRTAHWNVKACWAQL
jgi:hypothetical protein